MKPLVTMVCAALLVGPALAQQTATPLKIGVLSDFSSVYSDIGGMGNVEATKMAIEDFRQADRTRHRRRAEQA